MSKILPYFWLLIFTVDLCLGLERKLGVMNFNCSNPSDTHNNRLVIVEAIGDQDILYYLWDFGSKPSFLITSCSLTTRITLNCSSFLNYSSNSIGFSTEPTFTFGTVFNKMYEFDDQNDIAIPTNTSLMKTYNTEELEWSISVSAEVDEIARVVVTGCGKVANSSNNCSIKLSVCAYAENGKAFHPPHLLHSMNSSQVDLILADIATSFNHSRFAAEFLTFSSIQNSTTKSIELKTMDDENTPGVFTLDTVTFEGQENSNSFKRGYLQWRPIVYTTDDMVVSKSSRTNIYKMTNFTNPNVLNCTLLYAIFGERLATSFLIAQDVSFGSPKDKFYKATNYNSWSFVMGIGDVPSFPFSFLVLGIIVFGLGIPALIVIGGITFIIFQQMRKLRLLSCMNHEPLIADE